MANLDLQTESSDLMYLAISNLKSPCKYYVMSAAFNRISGEGKLDLKHMSHGKDLSILPAIVEVHGGRCQSPSMLPFLEYFRDCALDRHIPGFSGSYDLEIKFLDAVMRELEYTIRDIRSMQ